MSELSPRAWSYLLHASIDLKHAHSSRARSRYATWPLAPPSGVPLTTVLRCVQVLVSARSSTPTCSTTIDSMLRPSFDASDTSCLSVVSSRRATEGTPLAMPSADRLLLCHLRCRSLMLHSIPRPSAAPTARGPPTSHLATMGVEVLAGRAGCAERLPAAIVTASQSYH